MTLEVLDLAPNAVADRYLIHPTQMPIASGVLSNDCDRDGVLLSAEGECGQAKVIEKIWSLFDVSWMAWMDRPLIGFLARNALPIRRADDGVNLGYYRTWPAFAGFKSTAKLLDKADGQCDNWACLFRDLLAAQGISDSPTFDISVNRIDRDVAPGPDADTWFMVKNWEFRQNGGLLRGNPKLEQADKEFEYANTPAGDPFGGSLDPRMPSLQGNAYTWRRADVKDQPGVAGPDSTNPMSLFNNHIVLWVGNRYYDPSYGQTYTTLPEMQDTAIAGFYRARILDETEWGIDFNSDAAQADQSVRVFQIRKIPNELVLKDTTIPDR